MCPYHSMGNASLWTLTNMKSLQDPDDVLSKALLKFTRQLACLWEERPLFPCQFDLSPSAVDAAFVKDRYLQRFVNCDQETFLLSARWNPLLIPMLDIISLQTWQAEWCPVCQHCHCSGHVLGTIVYLPYTRALNHSKYIFRINVVVIG